LFYHTGRENVASIVSERKLAQTKNQAARPGKGKAAWKENQNRQVARAQLTSGAVTCP
jgi:hypothetical protein